MSLITNSSDINFEIFKYLNIEELLNLYKTCKLILKDIDKFSFNKYKKNFKQLYLENKCIHCNNLSDNMSFRLCDKCALDTCWTCFNKVGSLQLFAYNKWDNNINVWYPSYKCFGHCIYKCFYCKRNFNKYDIVVNNSVITCITCIYLKFSK